MDKKDILFYFDQDIITKGRYYTYENLPSQISQAIYLYGDSDIQDIVIFIDDSDEQDGSSGMIITPQALYYQFAHVGKIIFNDILSLSLQKHRHQDAVGYIKTNQKTFAFDNTYCYIEKIINALSQCLDLDIHLSMTNHEKIEHYLQIILHDIENDEYEDVILTPKQKDKIQEFYQNLDLIQNLDDENYNYELETLCPQALAFFDELEFDSEEIDCLYAILEELNQKEDQMFQQAKQYYDDMMNQYQQGDSQMYNQMKSMMNMLGIHEEDLKDKSPEELNQYIEDLCSRFGISKSQIENLAKRFQK